MNLKHWESYYRGGALVSCPTNPEPYYTMEVRQAWENFFAALDDGARILDLGTGNGPIALIARETADANARTFQIDGVDLADIDPHNDVPEGTELLRGINFHAGVNTEDLPFADGQFAAVSGQYIVEYTDAGKSLAECLRVLSPGGRCQFILHHLDSIIVRNGIESLRQADIVQHETKTLRKFRRYCERSSESPARADSARRQLLAAGAQLQRMAEESSNPLLLKFVIDSVSALLRNRERLSRGQMLQRTNLLERELRNWVLRLQDLVSAALSERDVADLLQDCRALGFSDLTSSTQMQGSVNLIGWRLTMTRPP